jgi:hypothetical protein
MKKGRHKTEKKVGKKREINEEIRRKEEKKTNLLQT